MLEKEVDYRLAKWLLLNMEKDGIITSDELRLAWIKMSGSGKEFEAEWSVAERGFKFAAVNYATFFLYNRRYTAGGNPKGFFVYILVLL